MKISLEPIETAILETLYEQKGMPEKAHFSDVAVTEREYTGVGFLTELESSEELRVSAEDVSFVWDEMGATLNEILDVGFVVFIKNGYVKTIEGYTFGTVEWPSNISDFELRPFNTISSERADPYPESEMVDNEVESKAPAQESPGLRPGGD